ncbi:endonuclease/exonuclease/phosphatase family protein [Kitasatospora sp. NPDC094028]
MAELRIATFNTLFGGRDDEGYGDDRRWQQQARFLRSLEADTYALQECTVWDVLGGRRLHQARRQLGMTSAFLAFANKTTTGHRFHTALLFGPRVSVLAEDGDRARYHHVLGWASVEIDGDPVPWAFRNLHLDPFDPANRAREVQPLQTLADPGRRSVLLGDANSLGFGHPEPDWAPLPAHLRNAQLGLDEPRSAQRTAMELLQAAGFTDVAHARRDDRFTGGFGVGDVPRRQDLVLLSPALAPAVVGYEVHDEPVTDGFSDHAAVVVTIELDRLH